MNQSAAIVVLMTAASDDEANRIAELLVEKKLAACVQILPPMRSVYLWKGEIARDEELLLLVKTLRSNFPALESEVRAIHSYETPEIIALEIKEGSADYLNWLFESCAAS
jgi:periplasmic divalent cation tolerance protein